MSDDMFPWDQWNQPEGDYPDRWKPENPGDRLVGRLIRARVATMPDGKRLPSLTLLTANGEIELLAAQVDLQRKLAEARPRVGQTLDIHYIDLERLQGGKTLKRFAVLVDGVVGQAGQAAAAPSAATSHAQAATPTGLTNEQIVALTQTMPAAVTPAMYAQLAESAPAATAATFTPSDLV